MDVRSLAFDVLTRDATLRRLLSNYVWHLEAGGGGGNQAAVPCFVSLSWADDGCTPTVAERGLLTIQVHVSREAPCPPDRLDRVMEQLRVALTAAVPNPGLTARCLTTSGTNTDSRFGTLVKSSTWAIAAVQRESTAVSATRLAPWSVRGRPHSSRLVAGGAAAHSLN